MQSRTVTVSVAAPVETVCAFASNPQNLPLWLGFCRSVTRAEHEWQLDTDAGQLALAFVEPNRYGVLDHRVRLPDGSEIINPMRVVANGTSSEVLFTLFRTPDMNEAEFIADLHQVEQDLATLKHLLESAGAST